MTCPRTFEKFSASVAAFCLVSASAFVMSFSLACSASKETLAKEGKIRRQSINQALASLDAAASKTPEKKTDLFGNPITNQADSSMDEKKVEDWSSPAEVVVVLQTTHDRIDTSPAAQRVSNKLRSMGSTGMSIGGSISGGWTAVPGGMQQRIWDQISFKPGGAGPAMRWDHEQVDKIVQAAAALKSRFSEAGDELKKTAVNEGADLVQRCEMSAKSTGQILEAASQVLAAQLSKDGTAKPDEKSIQGAVERMLKARAEIREALAAYDLALSNLGVAGAK